MPVIALSKEIGIRFSSDLEVSPRNIPVMIINRCCAGSLTAALLLLSSTALGIELELSTGLQHFGYQEFDDGGDSINQENGWIPGLQVGFSEALRLLTLSGSVSYFAGRVDYEGETQRAQPFSSDTDQKYIRASIGVARRVSTAGMPGFDVFADLGIRVWDRNIRGDDRVSGLLEEYQWWEAALGVGMPFKTSLRREWRLESALLYILDPRLTVVLPEFDDPTLELGEGLGLRIQAQHRWWTESGIGFRLTAFAEGWNFGRSNDQPLVRNGVTQGMVHEPRSESRHWGISFSVSRRY